ncbi:MAG: phosphoesterase [Legionellales bacterium]|nr:MAG: phosphoesterase [Legionellales bacterium]
MRAIESHQEHAANKIARDTRPLGIRAAEFICKPNTLIVMSGASVAAGFLFPMAVDLLFIVIGCVYIFAATRQYHLPFRMPMSSDEKDHNDPIPGTQKARKAGGISFFGNEIKSGEELWFTNDDLRTHILIFGSTGSGKTEALISIAYNSLLQGSGFIYIDGKGDNSLFAKIFSMVRSMGREDDLLLINFMTGARDVLGPQKNRLSNTMNPFSSGSSSMISQMVVSLMGDSKAGGGGDMWKGRAINFVESLMKVMVPLRDAGHILLDANSIREFFILEKLEEIVIDKVFPLSDGTKIPLKDFPPQITEGLTNYILNLPGFTAANKGEQESGVREQHGFITMQLTRVFSSLADTYGHIIRTNLAEVDIKDVVLNRRILVVLLPALEKSPDELSNLGKIIIAALKAMMAAGLGDAVEGDYRDVILRKPTNSPTPYVCIMDEYGYYAVQGFAVVPAQARSLGFSAIFAGQDLPAFQKASKEEAASICANTNVKICMKLEDPQETWEFFNKVAGETYVTNVSNFQMQANSLSINYLDSRSASVDRRARIELMDLKDQREGEAHIFFKSKIVRASMFYANPAPVARMQINHCLKVAVPATQMLLDLTRRLDKFTEVFSNSRIAVPELESREDETITVLQSTLKNVTDVQPFEREWQV